MTLESKKKVGEGDRKSNGWKFPNFGENYNVTDLRSSNNSKQNKKKLR
jgi:hypothetical protein